MQSWHHQYPSDIPLQFLISEACVWHGMTFSSATEPDWTPWIPELALSGNATESITQKDPTVNLPQKVPHSLHCFSLCCLISIVSPQTSNRKLWSWSAKNGTYVRSQHWAKYHIKGIKLHDWSRTQERSVHVCQQGKKTWIPESFINFSSCNLKKLRERGLI